MKYILIIIGVFAYTSIFSQEISGKILDEKGNVMPGANIIWQGTKEGTSTNKDGKFTIKKNNQTDILIISFIGYKSVTYKVKSNNFSIKLKVDNTLKSVDISERKSAMFVSKLDPINTQHITGEAFHRAACCNLSESFETNASVDVAYADAVTGSKQIRLLGLEGKYVQLLTENIPNLRSLSTTYGLNYIPGSWMESIQISKGAASVRNGYEGITGQINTEFKKPDSKEVVYLNALTNSAGKYEGNFNARYKINDKISTMLLGHYENMSLYHDRNDDGFVDLPLTIQTSFFNRWKYKSDKYVAQIGLKVLDEQKKGGQIDYWSSDVALPKYGMEINTKRYEAFFKNGYIFDRKNTSLALITNAVYHDINSFYGLKTHTAKETDLYANLLFESYIGKTNHMYAVGISSVMDDITEQLNDVYLDRNLDRNEITNGAFLEYSYKYKNNLSLIAGARVDNSNIYGTFFTPRFNLRYSINEDNIFRVAIGKGYRSTNVLAENSSLLASSRTINFTETLEQEEAFNYGISYTKFVHINGRKLTLMADYYRTDFQNQIIIDLDANTTEIQIYNLNGESFSNSYQIELNYEPIKKLDVTAAYRYNDVRMTINEELQ
ncbi:MAG: TonB-dependent receptor, partial [Bacteroidales bacterium]|nr:TonB-dependent receptor [Bacteroidales bacterium]